MAQAFGKTLDEHNAVMDELIRDWRRKLYDAIYQNVGVSYKMVHEVLDDMDRFLKAEDKLIEGEVGGLTD